MNGRVYEFVVTGRLGPNLRSMLTGLEIEDRPPHTRLTLQPCDQVTLLCAVATIAAGTAEIDTIRSWPAESVPDDACTTATSSTARSAQSAAMPPPERPC
jgi:hypothetical protein